ncbi:hypothetical protein [Haloimpatiens lingqiaonensis]|uniref:hypothetical protein n=1 Tax=Haloimpatiens lingqiaonensis TaxID=1380675 RepID=UPI0010FF5D29|nr:hypothetical protein [Haloimpatiens lingqiaonensis]
MEYLLKQFEYGDTIYLLTDDGYFYDGWIFLGINNNILTLRYPYYSGYVEKISVCKIESIGLPPEGQDIEDIELLDNKCKPDKGYCGCCEAPIRKQLESYRGLYVYIYTDNYSYDGYVYAVSDGIVILEYYGYYIAISTCKIISVGLEQFTMDGVAGTEESGKNNPKLTNITNNPLQEKSKKK